MDSPIEELDRWENEGGTCRPDQRSDIYYDTPAQIALERRFDAMIARMVAGEGRRR